MHVLYVTLVMPLYVPQRETAIKNHTLELELPALCESL